MRDDLPESHNACNPKRASVNKGLVLASATKNALERELLGDSDGLIFTAGKRFPVRV